MIHTIEVETLEAEPVQTIETAQRSQPAERVETVEPAGWSASNDRPSATSVLTRSSVCPGSGDRLGSCEAAARTPSSSRPSPRVIEVRTPTGHRYRSQAPPLLGWGWEPTRQPILDDAVPSALERHLEALLGDAA